MSTKIQKWGNSLGLRIPKQIAELANITEDTEVSIEHKDGVILVFPKKSGFKLTDLLQKIDKTNLHQGDDFDVVGKEVW